MIYVKRDKLPAKTGKRIGYLIALACFLILTLGPFLWTFVLSVTPEYAMTEKSAGFFPDTVTYANYRELLTPDTQKGSLLITGIKNALDAVAVSLALGIPISLLTAYTLSRMKFCGRKLIKNLLLITMVIPVMATIIPLCGKAMAGRRLLAEYGIRKLLSAHDDMADIELSYNHTGGT